jgi:hypothetical protein
MIAFAQMFLWYNGNLPHDNLPPDNLSPDNLPFFNLSPDNLLPSQLAAEFYNIGPYK